jgi:uncharacterized protein YcfL
MKKFSWIIVLLLASLLLVTGCSKKQEAAAVDEPKYVIGVIPFADTAA